MTRSPRPSDSGAFRVLFLDDEPDIVDAFVMAARLSGVEAEGHTQPLQALARFREDPAAFDAVITDYTMPQMNYADFIAGLRAIRGDIPVHLCTGNAEHEIQGIVGRLGIRSVLYKPFDFEALAAFLGAIAGPQGRASKAE